MVPGTHLAQDLTLQDTVTGISSRKASIGIKQPQMSDELALETPILCIPEPRKYNERLMPSNSQKYLKGE